MTIEQMLIDELNARLTRYKSDIAAQVIDRDTANSRYLRLQWALFIENPKKHQRPATEFDIEEIIQELRSWILDIQRNHDNAHYAGKQIKRIESFIEQIKPVETNNQAKLW
jgi:hypothetical protein